MTRTLPLAALLALAAALLVPAAAALGGSPTDDVKVEARVGLDPGAPPAPETPEAPQAPGAPALGAPDPADPGALLDAAPAPVEDALRLASVDADASADAGGTGVAVGAPGQAETADASEDEGLGEAIARAVVPAVEEHGPAAVATVGVAALLQALGVWRFLGLGGFALYSRLTKSDLLDNEHRDRVYKLIQEKPGMGVSEIAGATGLGWGTTVYHLDRLERAGFVASERGGVHRCYFPVGTVAREMRKGVGALKNDTTRSVAGFLLARPGATQTDLCEALGLSASAASKQVTKLEQAGLVRRERDWKTVHLFPDASLAEVMQVSPDVPTPPQPATTPLAAPLPA